MNLQRFRKLRLKEGDKVEILRTTSDQSFFQVQICGYYYELLDKHILKINQAGFIDKNSKVTFMTGANTTAMELEDVTSINKLSYYRR